MLCTQCSSLNAASLVHLAKANRKSFSRFGGKGYVYWDHHNKYDDLIAAAEAGCEICQIIRKKYATKIIEFPRSPHRCTSEKAFRIRESQGKPASLKVRLGAADLGRNFDTDDTDFSNRLIFQSPNLRFKRISDVTFSLQVPLGQSIQTVHGMKIGNVIVDRSTASETNFRLAREWMRTCIDDHAACPPMEPRTLPTRVIQVDQADPVLITTHGSKGKYIALSHCWGGPIDKNALLSTETIDGFRKKISLDVLPANFRDAILITRSLGVPYLWIDSLCIIQNSTEDWEIESEKMKDVYRNAYLTVAAASASCATEGILHTYEQDSKPPDLASTKQNAMKLKLCEDSGPDDCVNLLDWNVHSKSDFVTSGPLAARGWTLQEKILSPRILYYGTSEIYWECMHGYQSADGSSGFKYSTKGYTRIVELIHQAHRAPAGEDFDKPQTTPLDDVTTLLDDVSKDKIAKEYQLIVQEFTRRKLTCKSDKLHALAGISKLVHEALGGDYMAGVFSTQIRHGLLWYRYGRRAPHVVPYRAPSWSWAVTNAPITLPFAILLSSTYDVVLEEHHFELSGTNQYGPLKDGAYIKITNLTKTVKLFRTMEVFGLADENPVRTMIGEVYADGNFSEGNGIYFDEKGDLWWETINDCDSGVQEFKIILISQGTTDRTGFDEKRGVTNSEKNAHCLLLMPEGPDANTYRRTGYLRLSWDFYLLFKVDGPRKYYKLLDSWTKETIKLV